MSNKPVNLGEPPEKGAGRDAIHVAVYPAINLTNEPLTPGAWMEDGVVDPFLAAPVAPGERYWLLLFPETITDLRHVWRHKNFGDERRPDELAHE